MRLTAFFLPFAVAAASSAQAELYKVTTDGVTPDDNTPVLLTCLDGQTVPEDAVGNITKEIDVEGALAVPLTMEWPVIAGASCIARFEEESEERGWNYIIEPLD